MTAAGSKTSNSSQHSNLMARHVGDFPELQLHDPANGVFHSSKL